MQIIDAQIHVWGQGLPSNMAHRQVTSFTTDEVVPMMDEAGVDAAVIHPVPWDPDSTAMAMRAVRDFPGRFAIMGSLPLEDPGTLERIGSWREQPSMLGLRYMLVGDAAKKWLAPGVLDAFWAACERAAVPVALLCTDSLDEIGRIAERHPGLRITIDHLGGRGGNTTLKDHAAMTHMPQLLALARHPNVAVKVTGAPGYSGEAYPFPIMGDYCRRIYEAFGPRRTFWGTDISKMPVSWRQCIAMFTEAPWLPKADQPLVMGQAICDWWGWRRAGASG